MYTKILLLAASTILVTSSISIETHNQKIASEKNVEDNVVTQSSHQASGTTTPYGIDLSDIPHQDTQDHSHSHSSDDDGKSHHFHFEHFTHRRRTMVFLLLGKIVLMATFISSLISSFYIFHV